MNCLETVSLCKTYAGGGIPVKALDHVSLTVETGEFVALVGPSGSGKTTLLNMLGGLDVPSSGRVVIGDVDMAELSERQRSLVRRDRIGFVFQDYNLIPVLSAVENVEYVMLLQGLNDQERTQRALAALDAVGLEGLASRRPNQLSGGQQQRVAVARAIATEPMIVLADEPTANLDSGTGDMLLDLLGELNQNRGITFLLSTHDPRVMDRTGRVLRMRDGQLE